MSLDCDTFSVSVDATIELVSGVRVSVLLVGAMSDALVLSNALAPVNETDEMTLYELKPGASPLVTSAAVISILVSGTVSTLQVAAAVNCESRSVELVVEGSTVETVALDESVLKTPVETAVAFGNCATLLALDVLAGESPVMPDRDTESLSSARA